MKKYRNFLIAAVFWLLCAYLLGAIAAIILGLLVATLFAQSRKIRLFLRKNIFKETKKQWRESNQKKDLPPIGPVIPE